MNIESLSEYIIFEDEHIIVVNKTAGILSQPGINDDISLQQLIEARLKHSVFIINRIDWPASGLIIYAKSKYDASAMTSILAHGLTKKTYIVITENKPDPSEGILENKLKKKGNKTYISADNEAGKIAVLKYKYLKNSTNYHFIEVELVTGRFHQIRAQLANIGCPVMGDVKYGARRSNKDRSIGLHSWKLEFIHPYNKNFMTLTAELPDVNIWKSFTS
jgi:23S rRNA pseudouridine1911/1915/1917 synthase